VQVIFAVTDLRRSLEFYKHAFGWPRNERIDYSNYVEFLPPDGGALGLYERAGFAATVGAEPAPLDGRVSPAYLYVRVEDVRATVAALEEAGGRLLSPLATREWGEEAAWFADPDGNVLAVAQATTQDAELAARRSAQEPSSPI
jgi:predicted enzyme related to lactoylglutathione lyase